MLQATTTLFKVSDVGMNVITNQSQAKQNKTTKSHIKISSSAYQNETLLSSLKSPLLAPTERKYITGGHTHD
jgi:hypothetical protein